MSLLFFNSIRAPSCALMIMMMIMMIVIVMFLHWNCRKFVAFRCWVSVSDRKGFVWSSSAGLSLSLSLSLVHSHHPFVRPAAAHRRQYLAHNIMHGRSHQSSQCRTLTITSAPASPQEEPPRGAGRNNYQSGITCLSSLSAAADDFRLKLLKRAR